MTWQAGARVVVRSACYDITAVTTFSDCEALDLAREGRAATRTLLVPFDRPRTPAPPPLRVVSRRRLAREVAGVLRSAFPYGGLRFCPPQIRLLTYQLEPALSVLRHGALRVLVGDDVGLGKTVEAGLIVNELVRGESLSRVLILCPASILHQWAHELSTLFDLTSVPADATWLRRMERELPEEVNPWSIPGVYLASLDFVKRAEALHALEQVRWDLLVVDEAHSAAPGTDRRAAVHALANRAYRLVLLTATPHSGDPEHFAALCALGSGTASPLVFFRRSREDVAPTAARPRTLLLPVRPTDDERRMHELLDAYTRRVWAESTRRKEDGGQLVAAILRKRALSSAASLARTLRRRIDLVREQPPPAAQLWLPLADEDAIEGDGLGDAEVRARGLDDPSAEAVMLHALLEAAAAAEKRESKISALLRFVRRAQEPVVLFTEFRDTAEHLHQVLEEAGHRACLLHGGQPQGARIEVLRTFASGGWHLVTTDAASEGLNLHHSCRLVVHFELPWTPSRLRQRAGRVHRIGQARRVHELALVAGHTCERFVLAPLAARSRASAGFAAASLVDRIPESRVAAHILGDAPLPGTDVRAPAMPAHVRTVDLRSEANTEAARLEAARRLGQPNFRRRSPARRVRCTPVGRLALERTVLRSAATVLVGVTLGAAEGGPFEHLVLPISVDAALSGWPRGHQALRAAVGEMLNRLSPAISSAVAERIAWRLRDVGRVRAAAVAALQRREDEMRRELASTARELVQHGLFDRRAMRASLERDRVAAGLRDAVSSHRASAAAPDACRSSFEVCAVLVGTSR